MNAHRLNQIEEVYHAALEIEPARQEFLLLERWGADVTLRQEVFSLLSPENNTEIFFDHRLQSSATEIFDEKNKTAGFSNQEIRHYRVVKSLGRAASAKMRESSHGEVVIDYFHLPKVQDEWLTVSKLWDAEP